MLYNFLHWPGKRFLYSLGCKPPFLYLLHDVQELNLQQRKHAMLGQEPGKKLSLRLNNLVQQGRTVAAKTTYGLFF